MVLKSLGLVVVGAVAALIVSGILSREDARRVGSVDAGFPDRPAAGSRDAGGSASGLAATESDSLEHRIAGLEAGMRELSQTVAALEDANKSSRSAATVPPEVIGVRSELARNDLSSLAIQSGNTTRAFSSANPRDFERDQLIAAGFPAAEAERILRRSDELAVEALEAQYNARRNGEAVPDFYAERMLRTELGDTRYEQYLTARRRPTWIQVNNVMATSPAEKAGLRQGDKIVSYGNRRVFDIRELNDMILEGNPGEPVILEVERQGGQTTQLVVPRGPLGVNTGGVIISSSLSSDVLSRLNSGF